MVSLYIPLFVILLVTLFQKFKRQPNTRISFTRSFMLPKTLVSVRLTHGIIWDQSFDLTSLRHNTTHTTSRKWKLSSKISSKIEKQKNYLQFLSLFSDDVFTPSKCRFADVLLQSFVDFYFVDFQLLWFDTPSSLYVRCARRASNSN